jgi:hypothetical protein
MAHRYTLAALSLTMFGVIGCGNAGNTTPKQDVKVVVLDDQATALRDDFNRDRGNVRLMFLVDPICPGCLRGIADIDRDLLSQLPANSKLKVYVVHEPVIGASERDIPRAVGLMHTSVATHYWNESGAFGKQVSQALDLRNGGDLVYAWDVWMVFPPDAEWTGTLPKPQLLMHQLQDLMDNPRFPFLDSNAFAAHVHGQLKSAGAGS